MAEGSSNIEQESLTPEQAEKLKRLREEVESSAPRPIPNEVLQKLQNVNKVSAKAEKVMEKSKKIFNETADRFDQVEARVKKQERRVSNNFTQVIK